MSKAIPQVTTSDTPDSHATRVAQRALAAIPDADNARVIVMTVDNATGIGGVGIGGVGYDNEDSFALAIADILKHPDAMCSAHGLQLRVMTVPGPKAADA